MPKFKIGAILVFIILITIGGLMLMSPKSVEKPIKYGEEPKEWFTCEVAADCVYLDSSVCSNQKAETMRAVNVDYQNNFLAVTPKLEENQFCTQMFIAPPETPPTCEAGVCTKVKN